MDKRFDLGALALDDEGRVILSDDALETLAGEYGPVMAGGRPNNGCVNPSCVGTGGGNNIECSNGDCQGTSNTRCTNN